MRNILDPLWVRTPQAYTPPTKEQAFPSTKPSNTPKPKNNPTRKTWSRKVDETGSSGDYATFLRQQEDNRKRQLHTDIQGELDGDAQRRFNQERDVLMATYNKLRENPSLLDDKPEAMKAFNTLLGKYGMPEYNKDTFISNLNRNNNQQMNNSFKNNTQQNQNQYQNTNQQTRELPEGTYDSRIKWTPGNFGNPFTAPSVSPPSQNPNTHMRTGSESYSPHTSSGRWTPGGTHFDTIRQNNSAGLHLYSL